MLASIIDTIVWALLGGFFYYIVVRPWLSIPDISSSIDDLTKAVDRLTEEIKKNRGNIKE